MFSFFRISFRITRRPRSSILLIIPEFIISPFPPEAGDFIRKGNTDVGIPLCLLCGRGVMSLCIFLVLFNYIFGLYDERWTDAFFPGIDIGNGLA